MPDQRTVLANMKVAANRLKEIGTGVRVSRVLGERVLVKTVVPHTELDEVQKRGSIYIPEHIKKDYVPMPTTGAIIAVGEGVKSGHLSEGDMVLFPRVAGMDFTIAEADLRILHVNDILAVLVDTDDSVVLVKGEDVKEGVGEDV